VLMEEQLDDAPRRDVSRMLTCCCTSSDGQPQGPHPFTPHVTCGTKRVAPLDDVQGPPWQTDTVAQLQQAYAGATVLDLLLAGVTADAPDEVDQVAHLSLALFDHVLCTTPIELPDGRVVASLHAHISGWRYGLAGFTTRETPTSGLLARGRPPLPAST